MNENKNIYRKSQIFYIISATLEYFISILTGTAYLAKIAGSIGISDGTVGVLSSFTALGCAFQIVSLTMRTDRAVKPRVLAINLVNQLCFTLLQCTSILQIKKRELFGLVPICSLFLLYYGNSLFIYGNYQFNRVSTTSPAIAKITDAPPTTRVINVFLDIPIILSSPSLFSERSDDAAKPLFLKALTRGL